MMQTPHTHTHFIVHLQYITALYCKVLYCTIEHSTAQHTCMSVCLSGALVVLVHQLLIPRVLLQLPQSAEAQRPRTTSCTEGVLAENGQGSAVLVIVVVAVVIGSQRTVVVVVVVVVGVMVVVAIVVVGSNSSSSRQ